MTYIAPKS